MDWLRWAYYVLYSLLAVLAVLVARREPLHRPFAAFVIWMVSVDWVRMVLRWLKQGAATPYYTGGARFVHHVDEGLVLSWSFVMLALTLHSFTRIKPWSAVLGWAIALAICLDYPTVRGPVVETVYRASALACLGIGLGAIAWALMVRHELKPRLHHLCIMAYQAADGVAYLMPYMKSMFDDWQVVRAINLVLLTCLNLLHAQELIRPRRLPPRKLPR